MPKTQYKAVEDIIKKMGLTDEDLESLTAR